MADDYDRLKSEVAAGQKTVPPRKVEDRLTRGRDRLRGLTARRNLCWEFYRDNTYAWVNEKNTLQQQATVTTISGGGKPRWQARSKRNMILDAVLHEVSAATQRVPSYEVVPSTTDADDKAASNLAEKVALFGYDKWGLRAVTRDAVTHAVVADEAFAWPYFDTTVGPYHEGFGEGEVKVRVYGANEVFWEPGQRFEDSTWHAIEHARPQEQVEGEYDTKLTADADTDSFAARGQTRAKQTKQVLVTEYLERPSPKNPDGRWLCIANKRVLADKGAYPGDGDQPVLHKLSYITDPDNDRDLGLVMFLLSAQRTYQDCINKLVEWKNLALLPQLFVTPGLLRKQRITDEPGAVYEVPQPEQNVKWREVPKVPQELFQMLDQAKGDIARISAQNDIPSQVEAGKAIQALIERDSTRRQEFLANLADWHSRVMRSCLSLVAEHYSEERTLEVRGKLGWAPVRAFKGAQLRDQINVRVFPGSIEPRTKSDIERKVMAFAQLGWVQPEVAMSAINSGTAEKLVEDYDNDVAWANRRIQEIRDGPEALFSKPMRTEGFEPVVDGYGQPVMDEYNRPKLRAKEVPSWMPRRIHNVRILKAAFESWMKTEEYEVLEPAMQEAADKIYDALLQLEEEKNARAMQAQQAEAERMGMDNAAAPQGAKPLPSFPGVTPGAASTNGQQ